MGRRRAGWGGAGRQTLFRCGASPWLNIGVRAWRRMHRLTSVSISKDATWMSAGHSESYIQVYNLKGVCCYPQPGHSVLAKGTDGHDAWKRLPVFSVAGESEATQERRGLDGGERRPR